MSVHQRSAWADLQPELLELILQRLTLMDYRKCREICWSWRNAVDNALETKGRCPPASQLPFVLSLPLAPPVAPPPSVPPIVLSMSHLSLSRDNPSNLVSVSGPHQVFTMTTQALPDQFNGVKSVHGWLMFYKFYHVSEKNHNCCEISFFNPVSHARFNLPELFLFSGSLRLYNFHRIAFNSMPDSPDFRVVFLISFFREAMKKQRLAFCGVTHNSWNYVKTGDPQTTFFREIAVHEGKLYATGDYCGPNVVIVLSFGYHADAVTPPKRLDMAGVRLHPPLGDVFMNSDKLTVDPTSGEVLFVLHLCSVRTAEDQGIGEFRVFKLDLSGPRWCEIKHIGDRFLFWDSTGVKVVSARGLDNAHEFNGGNCIFFCTKKYVGVFSFADKSLRHFQVSSSSLDSFEKMWFSPSPW